jgi:hypothetical protein
MVRGDPPGVSVVCPISRSLGSLDATILGARVLLKSQEYGSDCMRSIEIELLDDDDDDQSHTDGQLVLYIYSNSRVGTPRKYSSGIRISGFPGKTVFHGAVIPRSCNSNRFMSPQYASTIC